MISDHCFACTYCIKLIGTHNTGTLTAILNCNISFLNRYEWEIWEPTLFLFQHGTQIGGFPMFPQNQNNLGKVRLSPSLDIAWDWCTCSFLFCFFFQMFNKLAIIKAVKTKIKWKKEIKPSKKLKEYRRFLIFWLTKKCVLFIWKLWFWNLLTLQITCLIFIFCVCKSISTKSNSWNLVCVSNKIM